MRFKKHIIIAVTLITLLSISGSRPAHSQESAIDRIKARLNKSGSVSPSEAAAAANEMQAAAEAKRRATEAAVEAAENGGDPGAAIADGQAGTIIDPELADVGEDETVLDPDLPSLAGMEFGTENEEAGAKDIFAEDPTLLAALGENPFIYQSAGLADPMVFPQLRNDTIFSELWARHEVLLKEAGIQNTRDLERVRDTQGVDAGKVKEAIEVLGRLQAMQDKRFTEQLDKQVALLETIATGVVPETPQGSGEGEGGPTPPVSTEPCPLPDELRSNLSFVIATGDDSAYCLIGDYMVRAGETVPEYQYVRVLQIDPGKVLFEITTPGCKPTTEEVTFAPTMDEGFFGKTGISGKSLLGTGKKSGGGGGSGKSGGAKASGGRK